MNALSKKVFLGIGFVAAVGAVLFLFVLETDPAVVLAKKEVGQANAQFLEYQNIVNAIPALELSKDARNDFKIEAAYLGAIGRIVPDSEAQAETLVYIGRMMSSEESRGSAMFHFDFDQGLEKISENAAKVSEVADEDLNVLEKLSNTFDTQVELAKSAIPRLSQLTVERNSKTEKYFLELDRIEQKLTALAASLDNYSSEDFRNKIKKIKQANELFGGIAIYTKLLIGGRPGGYALDVAEVFPEFGGEEATVKKCLQPPYAGCERVGPFPGGYQPMLRALESAYSELLKD